MKQLHFQFSPRGSQQELREIKDLYLWGELLKNIATDYCVTQSYISLLARQHGWQMRYSPRLHLRRPNGKIREDAIQGGELKQLLTWALDGVGHKTIAYRIGRHKNTVSRIALANGIRRYKRAIMPNLAKPGRKKAKAMTLNLSNIAESDDMNGLASVTGSVKWNSNKGDYGFIVPDGEDERQIFIHISDAPEGIETIAAGQRYRFSIETNKKGLRASNIFIAA